MNSVNLKRKITVRYQCPNHNTCGAKSIQMAAEYVLKRDLTWEEREKLSRGRMRKDKVKEALDKLGLKTKELTGKDFDSRLNEIKKALDEKDLPIIILYNMFDYKYKERDSHFSVVWGINQHNILVYDPYRWSERGGIKEQPVKINIDNFRIKKVGKESEIKSWGMKRWGIIISDKTTN